MLIISYKSTKYLFKYITKGPDYAEATLTQDEIKNYVSGRYLSATECIWRIFKFPITYQYPYVMSLAIHLPGGIAFSEDDPFASDPRITHLTQWMRYNQFHSNARHLLYVDFPKYFKYSSGNWTERRNSLLCVGRLPFIHPSQKELFYLRLLLLKIPGACSFTNLRTVNGVIYDNYEQACEFLGLIVNDDHWKICLQESVDFAMPYAIRHLFTTLLLNWGYKLYNITIYVKQTMQNM